MKHFAKSLLMTAGLLFGGNAVAQETLVWQFNKGPNPNDPAGGIQATINFHVPETDIFQAGGTCSPTKDKGFSNLFFVADVSSMQNGTPVKLRFSGNGKEVEVDGTVKLPQSEEGSPGVDVKLPNDSPLWAQLTQSGQVSYGVPGFGFNALNLVGGQQSLNSFVSACREFAGQPSQPVANNGGGAAAPASSGSGLSEKEAFGFARDLNTAAGYRAFLQSYPSGFFAELAKSYLSRLEGGGATTQAPQQPSNPVTPQAPAVPPPPPPVQFSQLNAGPDQASWIAFDYQEAPNKPKFPAAGVEMGGTALVAYCEPGKSIRLAFKKQDGGPADDMIKRLAQAQAQRGGVSFQVDSGETIQVPLNVSEETQTATSVNTYDPGSLVSNDIIRGERLGISGPSFNLAYQLKGSKVQMCAMYQRCGVQAPACAAPRRPVAVAPPPPPRQAVPRCRSRSVYIEGRGCVLRRSLDRPPPRIRGPRQAGPRCRPRSVFIPGRGCVLRRSAQPRPRVQANGCRRGQIRFEGRCMRRSETRGFCGPGFTPVRNRCVHNNDLRRPRPRRPRLQDGVFVTEAFCNRRGLIKEGNYCVEND